METEANDPEAERRLFDSPLITDADTTSDTASSDSGTCNLACSRSCWIISGRYGT
jgi:hypothetical protein